MVRLEVNNNEYDLIQAALWAVMLHCNGAQLSKELSHLRTRIMEQRDLQVRAEEKTQ